MPPWSLRLTLSDRFYTPTLIRPDNERWEKAHVVQIEAEHGGTRRHLVRSGPCRRWRLALVRQQRARTG
jgi:hypothetical protein